MSRNAALLANLGGQARLIYFFFELNGLTNHCSLGPLNVILTQFGMKISKLAPAANGCTEIQKIL